MKSRALTVILLVAAAVISGCQSVPPTNVHQPMTARPAPRPDLASNNGAIFNPVLSRSLFEDRRARYVGDTLTINIVENTSASTSSNSSANRTSSLSASVPTISGLPGKNFQGMAASASSENDFAGKGAAAAKNVFTGTIAVTVIEVLENGEKPGLKGRVTDINLIYTTMQEIGGPDEGTLMQIPNSLFFQRGLRRWPGGHADEGRPQGDG